jgi:hypothetical protein
VSTHDKPLAPGAARYIVDSLADDEAKRIEGLTDDELRAEIAAEGGREWKPPSTEDLLKRVEQRAAAGSAVGTPAASADAASGALTSAAVRGIPGPHPVARDERLGSGRRTRLLLLLAAALALGVVAIVWSRPPPIVTRPPPGGGEIQPEGQRAERLRDDAVLRCEAREWDACRDKLDEAKRIDPAGENEPRVMSARKAIAEGVK